MKFRGDVSGALEVIDRERPAEWHGRTLLVLGWSRLAAQAREGSGLNLSASELCADLVMRGWRVVYLQSGMDYSLRPGMWIELKEIWRGVGCFSLFNSPNLAPGNFNFRNITSQIDHAAQRLLVEDFVRSLRPDAVHVQALEGFPLSSLSAVRRALPASSPLVVTPHNYYYLCPQVDLLAGEREICENYDGGRGCSGCLSHAPDPKQYIAWRRRYQSAERVCGSHVLLEIKNRFVALRHGAERFKDPSVPVFENTKVPKRNITLPQVLPPRTLDQGERLLAANRVHASLSLSEHGQRRAAAIKELNNVTTVLSPSRFLADVYASMGVKQDVLAHVPLGQPHFDELHRIAQQATDYDAPAWSPVRRDPLRIAYFGNCYPNKGLATLCMALAHLPPQYTARLQVTIRASGDDSPFRSWVEQQEHLQGRVMFCGSYDISTLLAAGNTFDLCIFPNTGLENSPFVVLESLHAGRPVLASKLGGPTDFITPGKNGYLVASADPAALAQGIRAVLDGDAPLPSRKQVHAASSLVTFNSYVSSIEHYLRPLPKT